MKVPFASFIPKEREINDELRNAFERVFSRSWYIDGLEDEAFEKAFAEYCGTRYCVGVGNGLDALMLYLWNRVLRHSILTLTGSRRRSPKKQKPLCLYIFTDRCVTWIP